MDCSWDNPGHNPYQKQPYEAVSSYKDIPVSTRLSLVEKMKALKYDDVVVIEKTMLYSSTGNTLYINIRDMHFGKGKVCNTITRNKWKENDHEIALIYCVNGECLAVPTVCRNVSRITKVDHAALPTPHVDVQPPVDVGAGSGAIVPSEPVVVRNTFVDNRSNSFVNVSGVGIGYVIPVSFPVYIPVLTPVNTIPKPATWMLFLIGGILLWRLK